MLCQLRFKNFCSYRDETIFDMQAAGIGEFHDSLIPPPEGKFTPLLPVSVVFGPNGGGKSNAINALANLIARVLLPVKAGADYQDSYGVYRGKYSPFLLDEGSKDVPTEFELFFRTPSAQYQYLLSVRGGEVVEESLSCLKTPCKLRRPVFLFAREGGAIRLGAPLKRARVENVDPAQPYLSYLAVHHSYAVIRDVIDWFKGCCVIDVGVSNRDHQLGAVLGDPEAKARLLGLLAELEIPISDCRVDEDGGIATTHTVNGRTYHLGLSDESEGTVKLLSVLPGVILTLAHGGVLLVDELDAKLHPQLLKRLVKLYTQPERNPERAQLIFTCHDVSIMKNDLLRRDEIWFAAQNEENVSELWSLYDIQDKRGKRIKNTVAYDRQYLDGRYGADPYLKRVLERI